MGALKYGIFAFVDVQTMSPSQAWRYAPISVARILLAMSSGTVHLQAGALKSGCEKRGSFKTASGGELTCECMSRGMDEPKTCAGGPYEA